MKRALLPFLACLCFGTAFAAPPSWDPYRETSEDMIKRLCKAAVTTPDGQECLSAAYRLVDRELNRVYKTVTEDLKGDSTDGENEELKALKESQRAWIKFRDGERRLREAGFAGGSIATEEGLGRVIQVTIDRIDDLAMIASQAVGKQQTANQLEGDWVDPVNRDHWYRLKAKTGASGEYSCAGPSGSKSGSISRDNYGWTFSSGDCEGQTSETIIIGWSDHGANQRMRFVQDGSSVKARFIRQK